MARIKKLSSAYLMMIATAVATFFIINNLITDTINVPQVWLALNVLMLFGLAIGLIYNYGRKSAADAGKDGDSVTRGYLEANVKFYITVGVSIIFLHNWLAFLANGSDSLDGNHQAWIIWAVVDTMLPIILGITGLHMWKNADERTVKVKIRGRDD